MRFLIVGALLALNGLLIYAFGSSVGFTSTLITVIVILAFLAFSMSRDGISPIRRDPGDPQQPVSREDDATVRRSRGRVL